LDTPCVYLMHGVDDDAFCHMGSWGTLSDLLNPCRVCIFGFNEEAEQCKSLERLASMYLRKVMDDLEALAASDRENLLLAGFEAEEVAANETPRHLVLMGYGFGACLVHQMALQLEDLGFNVALIILDSEVSSWLPQAPTFGRLGGYPYLGGYVEAALLMCRAFGATEFARRTATTHSPEAEESGGILPKAVQEEVLMEAFWEASRIRNVTQAYFLEYVQTTGVLLDLWREIDSGYAGPDISFQGDTLFLRATDGGGDAAGSAAGEFRGAPVDCAKYCSNLEVADVPGNHYTMCQPTEAGLRIELPQAICEFLMLRGYFGKIAKERVVAAGKKRAGGAKGGRLARGGVIEFVD